MKKILSILMVAVMICTLAISAAAIEAYVDDEGSIQGKMTILKGTPTIDGVMDDIYKLSDSASCPSENMWTWGTGLIVTTDVEVNCWMLWDDNYLYIYATSVDSTPGVVNDDMSAWCHDGIEFGFSPMVGDNTKDQLFLRVRAGGFWDSTGAKILNNNEESGIIVEIVPTADGANFEIAIPLQPITNGGNTIKCGTIQAVDIYDSLALDILAKRAQPSLEWIAANAPDKKDYSDIIITLSAEEVGGSKTEETKADETKADETKADTTDKEDEKVDEKVDAPQTFDAGIIAAVAAIVSAAGYAISKKR